MIDLIKAILKYLPPYIVIPVLFISMAVGLFIILWRVANNNYIEISKEYRKRELATLFGAAEIVPDLAYAKSEEDWVAAKVKFWRYYAGKLVLVENRKVCQAMSSLGGDLGNIAYDDRAKLSNSVLKVSIALRGQIQDLQSSGFTTPLEKIFGSTVGANKCLGEGKL